MTQQVYRPPDIRTISKKGRQLCEKLDPELRQQSHGKFIVIAVDSGDYCIGDTEIDANTQARAQHPGKGFFLGRIGHPTAYKFRGHR